MNSIFLLNLISIHNFQNSTFFRITNIINSSLDLSRPKMQITMWCTPLVNSGSGCSLSRSFVWFSYNFYSSVWKQIHRKQAKSSIPYVVEDEGKRAKNGPKPERWLHRILSGTTNIAKRNPLSRLACNLVRGFSLSHLSIVAYVNPVRIDALPNLFPAFLPSFHENYYKFIGSTHHKHYPSQYLFKKRMTIKIIASCSATQLAGNFIAFPLDIIASLIQAMSKIFERIKT